jgi:glycosyltransferase involved in cell wall biosynthesis
MILGIDGRLANDAQRAGVGSYCAELLRALPAAAPDLSLRIYLDKAPRADYPVSPAQAEIRVLPAGRFWTQRVLGGELRRDPPHVFFSPVTQLPVGCRCPSLVTVHDLAFFAFGDQFTWKQRTLARLQARYVARFTTHLLADSVATQQDLASFLDVAPERVTVAPLAPAPHFAPPGDPSAIAALRAKHGLPERFVLHVGRLQPRKNIARLVEAFAEVHRRHPGLPHHLLLAGAEGWLFDQIYSAAAQSPVREYIHFLGYVSEEDLPTLYAAADVLALVSLWEGFGLPVIEAMACGTAVLTSNCSSLPEVAGDAAVQVDPRNTPAMAAALERLLVDKTHRVEVAQRGPAQAARFTWAATARILADAARRIARA